MMRFPLTCATLALAAMSLSACGGGGSGGASNGPAGPVATAGSANPLIGEWKVVDPSCPFLGLTFTADEMINHFAATMSSAAYDSKTIVEYEVRPGEVIVHDKSISLNTVTYEFDNENAIRLSGAEGCNFQRI